MLPQQTKKVLCNNTEVEIPIPQNRQSVRFTRGPQVTYCFKCNNQIQTNVEFKIGKGQLLFAGLLFAKLFCACIVPFLFQDCKDAVHLCPNCKAEVGRKNFIFE